MPATSENLAVATRLEKVSVHSTYTHICVLYVYTHTTLNNRHYIMYVYIQHKNMYLCVCSHIQHWTTGTYIMCVYIQHANMCICVCSVQFSHSVMSHSLQPHGLQHVRLPCPLPSPRAFSNSCPLHRWCHPTITISSSVVPFSSRLQSFTESESFLMSQLFTSGGCHPTITISSSVIPFSSHLQSFT